MASTYTDLLRLEKQADGENDTTWGAKVNTVFEMIEDAIAGLASVTHDDTASYALTTANSSTDEARCMVIDVGGALTANRNVVVPTSPKLSIFKNSTTGGKDVTVKTSAGTGKVVPNGRTTALVCDGVNVVNAIDYLDTLTVPDANFSIVDDADQTKVAKFQCSGISTATTRTFTLPDASTTVVGTDTTQTLTNKTLTTPVIAAIKPSAGSTLTLPDTTDTVVTLAASQTLTNKVLTTPDINAGTADSLTSLSIRDTSAAFDVTIAATSSSALTAGRTLTLDVVNAARTIKLSGNLTLGKSLTTSGAFDLTLTQTADTTVTLPTSGTLATLAGSETFTNKRVTRRVVTMADATSFTPNADTADVASQANTQVSGTLTANAPSGSPTDGQMLQIRIKSTNAQTWSWNAIYRGSSDFALPSATLGGSKWEYYGFQYNSADTKWDLIAYVQGF